ncbi:MAG TPA: hypothetical protein VGQ83_38395, partial [Polyangia bacterium]
MGRILATLVLGACVAACGGTATSGGRDGAADAVADRPVAGDGAAGDAGVRDGAGADGGATDAGRADGA